MSDFASFLRTPTPAPAQAVPSAGSSVNTITLLLILVIVILMVIVVMLARSSIRNRKANAQNTVPANPETNKFLSHSFDTASVESASVNPASVFRLSSDDMDKRKTMDKTRGLSVAECKERDAKRKVRRAFIRAMVAPTLLNLIYDFFISTDFFLENYIVTTPEYRDIYGYITPSFWGSLFSFVHPILNACLLLAWVPFVVRLFICRSDYRELANKPNGALRNALYEAGVCLLAFAVNFVGRAICSAAVIYIRSA